MADHAAHIPPGPRSHSRDAEDADATIEASEDLVATSPRSGSAPDQPTTAIDDGVDTMIGWTAASANEKVRSRELVAVGSGEPQRARSPRLDVAAEPSPWSGPRRDVVDDRPQWTFPGVAAEQSAPGAPAEVAPADDKQSEFPFAATAARSLAPPRPMPLFGPVGRARSTLLVSLASALTLGVYALIWHHDINRELEEFDPKLHSRPRRSMVALMVPWLAGLLVTLAGAALILFSRFHVHLPFDPHVTAAQAYYLLAGLAVVPYLVLLLPFSVVAMVMTLERLRCVEEHVGATTDRQVRPVRTSLLLAIPVVGGLALLAVEQRRLNAIWRTVTPSGHLKS